MSSEMKKMEGMTIITRSVTSFIIGITTMFGIYIAFYGHLTPGGGFAGGVIIAGAFIMLTLTHSKKVALKRFPDFWASVIDNFGALMFVVVGLLGYVGGYFFFNFLAKDDLFGLLSSGSILLSNIAIMLKVLAGLFSVFVGLSIFGRLVTEGEKED